MDGNRPKPRSKRTAAPSGKPPPKPNEPKSDEQKAHIWVLIEEGKSWREIARETGFSTNTVSKILSEDPAKLEALRSAKREERAKLWEQIERQSITALRDLIRAGHESLINIKTGKRKKRISVQAKEILLLGQRWAAVFRLAADSATTKAQLLTGGATARLEGLGGGVDAADMTDDQLIAAAKELGIEAMLPHDLRERMERQKPPTTTQGDDA